MARISLCLIARDEEALLPGCLASVEGAVDEIVVVDTGSTDRTPELARAAGARVVARPWEDDFAAPRNEALRHATGDWILVLDADERLAPGQAARLRAAVGGAPFDAGLVRLHNAARLDAAAADVLSGRARLGPPTLLPRLLRKTPDLAWRGRIHESVSDWLAARGMRTAPLDVDLVHLGYVEALRAARGKRVRNLDLLRRLCAERPDDVTPLGALALELAGDGAREEAAEVAARGWALLPVQPPDRSLLRLATARAIVALGAGDAAAVLEAARVGLERDGPQPDLLHLRGRALELLAAAAPPAERAALAVGAAEAHGAALALEGRAGVRQVVAGASSWASRAALAALRIWQGRLDEAGPLLEAALAEHPGEPGALAALAEAALARGDAAGALRRVEPALGDGPDGWLVAAEALARLGAAPEARLMLARARERAGRGFTAPLRGLRLAALEAALAAPPAR